MAKDRRTAFVKKWIKRGISSNDPFDKFFSLWIALVVAAQRLRTYRGFGYIENDKDVLKVLYYFEQNRSKVLEAIQQKNEQMLKLSKRKGTVYGDPVVDAGKRLRPLFSKLADHYNEGLPLVDDEKLEIVGELLNKIRNNVFHGIKVYDQQEDIELLELINPLLQEILQRCEPLV